MNRRPRPAVLLAGLFVLIGIPAARAQFVWTGGSITDGSVADPTNWQGGVAPIGNGSEDVSFGFISGTQINVLIPTEAALHNIAFVGSARPPYTFIALDGTSTLTLTGNVTLAEGNTVAFIDNLAINLTSGTHTVNVGGLPTPTTELTVDSSISGEGAAITKTGNGTLILTGNNSFTGDLYISQGTINVQSNTGTGLGALEFGNENDATVNFYSADPTIYGLEGDSVSDSVNLLGNPTKLTINQSENTVFAGTITGAHGSVVKTGAGSLTLSGANTYAGGTTVNAGTLRLGDSTRSDGGISSNPNDFDTGPVGLGTLTLNNGVTLSTAGIDNVTLANAISLPGSASHMTVDVSLSHPIESSPFSQSDSLELSGPISGPGALDLQGSGFFSLSGNNSSWTGGLNIYGNNPVGVGHNNALPGPLWFSASSTSNVEFSTLAPTIGGLSGGALTGVNPGASVRIESGSAILTINQTVSGIYDGIITGSGGLTKTGAGTLTLNTEYSTYTGATTINNGVLEIFWLTNGGEISSIGSSSNAASNLVLNGGTLRYTNGGFSTDRLFTLGINGGTLDDSGVGNLVFSNTSNIAFSGTTSLRTLTLTGDNISTTTLNPVIANPGTGRTSLVKSGTGTWALAGANTYTGVTKILGGTLIVNQLANGGTASNIGAPTDISFDTLWLNGGTLQYIGPGASTDRNFAIGVNGGTLDASGTGAIVFTNPATIGNLFAPSGARTLTLTGNNTGDNQLSGILGDSSTGTASLTKSGIGKWVLSGANTYTGGTTIIGGTLNVTSTGSLGTGALDIHGGTSVSLNNTAGQTVSYLTGGGTLSLASGVTLTDNQSANSIFSGGISGAGHLTKNNTGGLTLSGSNSYSGGTTINGGTIVLTNNSALGSISAAVTVNSGATLALNGVSTNLSPVLNSGSRLTGSGNLNTAIIGAGVTLSPGLDTNPIGTLSFADLTLGHNSILEINVKYDGESLRFDRVIVSNAETLIIAADDAHPLTLKLISLNNSNLPGTLGGASIGNTYTLFSLIQTQGISGSLTLGSNLLIDSTNFDTGNPGATFSFLQSGNNFNLSFMPTAVPEPSTYALMALGLGFIGLNVWRKRRR